MAPKSKKTNQVSVGTVSVASTADKQAPDWPAMVPIVPSMDLSITSLLPDQVLTISNFWTTSLCAKYVNFLSSLSLTTTPAKAKKGNALRVNDRFQIDDYSFAERLWQETALKELVEGASIDGEGLSEQQRRELWGGEVLGLNSNIRIYRYAKGQFFDQHCGYCNYVIDLGRNANL